MKIAALLAGAALAGMMASPVFANNWTDSEFDGLSIGIYGAGTQPCNCLSFGGSLGYGMGFYENFYGGFEVQGGVIDTGADFEALGLGKLGVLATDNVLVYGAGGFGYYYGSQVFAGGGGVDFKFDNNFGAGVQGLALNFGSGFSEFRLSGHVRFYYDGDDDEDW